MKDFKSNNKFGGGGRGGDRGGFRGGNTFGKRDWNGPKQMYDAICAKCGKSCQVPFRPSGERPVYCHDCFDKTKSNNRESDSFSRNDAPRRDAHTAPASRPSGDGSIGRIEEVKRLLDVVNGKLDRLLQKTENVPISKKESLKEVVTSVMESPKKVSVAKKGKATAKKAHTKKK